MNISRTNKIKIIIPCYNEEKRLNVSEFIFFCKINSIISFLFVDDGSTDKTLALLQNMADQLPNQISFMHLKNNQGKAEAVRQGFLHSFKSQEEYIGYWDADLATPLSAIQQFLKILVKHPHINVVIGSRVKLLGRNIYRNPVRHYCGRIFATFASFVLRIPIYDTQCGAKIFRNKSYLYEVFQKKFQSRWIFDVEILSRMLDFIGDKNCIYEIPLQKWTHITGSKLKFKDFLMSGYALLRLFMSNKVDKN